MFASFMTEKMQREYFLTLLSVSSALCYICFNAVHCRQGAQ